MSSMPKVTCPYELATAEFEVQLFEGGLAHDPENLELVEALAFAYTHCGRYADGLELDLKLCAALPRHALCFYNCACSYSLIGDAESSAKMLLKAMRLGYDEFEHLLSDEDLAFARGHPSFGKVLDQIRRKGGANL